MLPESPKFLLAMDEKEKALQVLRRVYAFNTGLPQEVAIIRFNFLLKMKTKTITDFF